MGLFMKSKPESERRERQDWLIVLLILLIGFVCVCAAAQWALRFSPSWKLNADMNSGIDPNSDFLTSKPMGFFEPVDSNILTQPAWVRVFLTPGAIFATGTPPPAASVKSTSTTAGTNGVSVTNTLPVATLTNTAVPTNTFIWIPIPATHTPGGGPAPTHTHTPNSPTPSANLRITKTSSANTFSAGAVDYTVVVSNAGPDAINNVVVTDNIPGAPAPVTSWTWACGPIVGGASGCDGVVGSNLTFTDTVNLPSGSSIQYNVTANVPAPTGNLINTITVGAGGYTETDPLDNQATWTHTLVIAPPSADLRITKTDGAALHVPGDPTTYTIVVSNLVGPSNITGATVTDIFPAQITGLNPVGPWCVTTGGATCGWSGSGNINDIVDLPVGSTITYQFQANTNLDPVNLVNTASVTGPVGYVETVPGDESVTDTDTLFVDPGAPPGGLGTYDNNPDYCINAGGPSITFSVSAAIDDDGTPDIIYYEQAQGPGIFMDKIFIEISDGYNWYPLLNWGDNLPNNNTTNLVNSPCGTETDNCPINGATLYNNTGILLNIPAILQDGPNSFIRITVPPAGPGDDSNVCIDAFVPYP